jgi:hypothetical protein
MAQRHHELVLAGRHDEASVLFGEMFPHLPEELQRTIRDKAVELGLTPEKPDGYTEDGEPVYVVEKIAERLGMTEDEARESVKDFLELTGESGISEEQVYRTQ